MWAVNDILVSKVMPRSFTEVTSGRDKPLIFKLGVIGMGPTHNMLHLLTAICICQSLHHAIRRSRANCKLSMSILVNTSAYIFKSSAKNCAVT